MTRTEYQRERVFKQIDDAFVSFAENTDNYSQGAINGTADTAYMLDVITTDEYVFIMDAVIAILNVKRISNR